ncbi:MAG: polysaccharide deacetylase family protein [Clostridia bacterium]|nr:polysaccharide deacetylase family protein [Clostridia bacterium]
MQKNTLSKPSRIVKKIVPNLVLGVLALSVGVLCFSPSEQEILTEGLQAQVYRSGGENASGISLMFNVYSGTEEVYQILQILQEFEAKATFFIGGCWADDNVACLRDIFIAGHEIGNHGYFHKDHDKLSVVENQREIYTCNRFIELSIGVVPSLFAPPSGAYGNATLTACEALNMKTILWSKDTIDWRDQDKNKIYTRATKNVQNGDFILMHPTKKTVEALDDILQYYKEINLTPITVSQNLQEIG